LSQVIADQQVSLAQFKVMIAGPYPHPTPAKKHPDAREPMKDSIKLSTPDSKDDAKKSSQESGKKIASVFDLPMASKPCGQSPTNPQEQSNSKGKGSKGRVPLADFSLTGL
jgi:hypothetical protein